jgi:hypothetical protein
MKSKCNHFNIQIRKLICKIYHYDLHFTFITIARGMSKFWGGKLYTSNFNNQRKYNTVMNVQIEMGHIT